jgi:DNA-binding MarR family transcriptional regulator
MRWLMSVADAHDLLERLCNLLRTELRAVGYEYGLQPVQLEALIFLCRCNRYSDTPQAVTEFLGLTKGTVSQTLKVLVQKGFLRKQGDVADKRLVHLKPMARGRQLVARATPAESLAGGFSELSGPEAGETVAVLRRLLRTTQQANGQRSFATCHSCRFNRKEGAGHLCGLTLEPLSDQDILLLCREHEYA